MLAETARAALQRPGLDLRAQVRRLPRARRARAGRAAPRATASGERRDVDLSRDRARARGAAVRRPGARRRDRRARRGGPAELPAAAAARAAAAPQRHPARGASSCRRRCYVLRPARASRASTCGRCRSSSASACCRRCCRAPGRCATSTTSRSRARRSTSEVSRLRLEGLIAKRADSPYRAGRSPRLAEAPRRARVATSSSSASRSRRAAAPASARCTSRRSTGGALVYCGRVGSGFDEEQLRDAARVRWTRCGATTPRLQRARCRGRGHVWVEPRLVAEVRYQSWTADGHAAPAGVPAPARRQAARGVPGAGRARARDGGPGSPRRRGRSRAARDRARAQARTPAQDAAPATRDAGRGSRRSCRRAVEKKVPFTNLGKIFWPDEGYTKGDLIEYYRAIAPWLLPYLKDRPLVLTRYPDGDRGQELLPEGRAELRAGLDAHGARVERGRPARDRLLRRRRRRVAALHRQPRHDPAARLGEPRHATSRTPTGASSTSTPRGAPFVHVVRVARAVHALARGDRPAGLRQDHRARPACTCWCRSGACCTFEQCKQLGELLARVVGGPAAGDRDHHPPAGRARRPRLHRLPAERPRQAARGPVQRAPGSRGALLRDARLGRGGRDARRPVASRSGACPSAWRRSAATRSRRCSPTSRTW